MLKDVAIIFIILIVATVLTALAKILRQEKRKPGLARLGELTNISRREPLTKREQEMYLALNAALPNCTVLAQVAFSALITTTATATRNRFDRKVADFVICTKQFNVIAVVELDDASHKNKATADEDRDALLKTAGYTTIRYKNVPDMNTIRKDITALMVTKKEMATAE